MIRSEKEQLIEKISKEMDRRHGEMEGIREEHKKKHE